MYVPLNVKLLLLVLSLLLLVVPKAKGTVTSDPNLRSPLTKTWSNRLGLTVTPIGTGLWAAERPFTWNGIDVGGRSVICRLPSTAVTSTTTGPGPSPGPGPLLVHSPVAWTESLGAAIDSLGGEVKVIIAPNYEHTKYTAQWAEKYPAAEVWGCPGLPDKLPQVKWTHEFSKTTDSNLQSSLNGVDVIWFDCEVNPFAPLLEFAQNLFQRNDQQKPPNRAFFNEVVFYHRQSKVLFVTDVFWNYPSSSIPNYSGVTGTGDIHQCPRFPVDRSLSIDVSVPLGTVLWKFAMDKIYLPFYKVFMVGLFGGRRRKYEERVNQLLNLDIEAIAPCHGDILRGKELCLAVLRKHFLE